MVFTSAVQKSEDMTFYCNGILFGKSVLMQRLFQRVTSTDKMQDAAASLEEEVVMFSAMDEVERFEKFEGVEGSESECFKVPEAGSVSMVCWERERLHRCTLAWRLPSAALHLP